MNLTNLLRKVRQKLEGKSLQDFLLTLGSNGVIAFLGAIAGILAARLLGPQGRGELAAAIVWAGILGIVSQVGMPQAITYATARNSRQLGTIFKSAMSILAVQSVLIVILGWIAAGLILGQRQPEAVDTVRIYLFSVPFTTLITYLSTMAQGLKQFQFFNAFRIAGSMGYIAVVATAYVANIIDVRSIVVWLLAVQIAVAATVAVTFILRFRHLLSSGHWRWDQVHGLLAYGSRSYLGSISWIANARLDQFVMSFQLTLAELGIYAVAASYAGLLFPLLGASAMVLFPHVAGEKGEKAKRDTLTTLKVNILLASAGCIGMAAVSPVLVPVIFGAEYVEAVWPAVVLLLGTVFLAANYVLSDSLRGLGHPLLPSIGEFIGLGVTVIGLLLFLPILGIVGAAFTSILSYGSIFFFLLISFYRTPTTQQVVRG